ncbi:MAG: helix-hairpin-helix domain-containing protein [Candidatus Bathyarchaeota archaeon]|nr:helix-hairpin-helix domain-containing protein [Candidatus Bathyarchaeota archaeon]MDH5788895.1 helix-hairpin-helix domain-containing protein [Candidatus Bathyarchaeota archaeon]
MRSDYALYVVAIILFILTAIVLAYQVELRELWSITTAVLGLLFIGMGYSQRPKPQATVSKALPPPIPPPRPAAATVEAVTEERKETGVTVTEAKPKAAKLTRIRGIGEKRAEQLKTLGIDNTEDLANASAKDLAKKLEISSKTTGRWIENAKKLAKKP